MSSTWDRLQTKLREQLDPEEYRTWFAPLRVQSESERRLILSAPNEHFVHTLEQGYRSTIDRALRGLEDPPEVLFDVETSDSRDDTDSPHGSEAGDSDRAPSAAGARMKRAGRRPDGSRPASEKKKDDRGSVHDPDRPIFNPRYRFSTFVVGSSNQFAHAASRAVAESPSQSYNPLFIYGGVGLGKTHLMHAIGHEISHRFPDLNIVYLTAEHFVNDLIHSIRFDRMTAFRDHYRTIDVLLIDDIQFIANKERTQEEFFHTFNALYTADKQIILSCDSSPRNIPTLEERLRSRFEWGLIADIQMPDLETKIVILRRKAEVEGIDLPDDVADFIAQNVKSNIRELEGSLNRVDAFASLSGRSIDLDLAKETLRDILPPENHRVNPAEIIKFVARHYGLKVREIKSKNNSKHIAFPRQVAMYLCKKLTELSYPDIGKQFNDKHHSTVMYSVEKIEKLRAKESEIDHTVQRLLDHFR